jgi:hypothetical protein
MGIRKAPENTVGRSIFGVESVREMVLHFSGFPIPDDIWRSIFAKSRSMMRADFVAGRERLRERILGFDSEWKHSYFAWVKSHEYDTDSGGNMYLSHVKSYTVLPNEEASQVKICHVEFRAEDDFRTSYFVSEENQVDGEDMFDEEDGDVASDTDFDM